MHEVFHFGELELLHPFWHFCFKLIQTFFAGAMIIAKNLQLILRFFNHLFKLVSVFQAVAQFGVFSIDLIEPLSSLLQVCLELVLRHKGCDRVIEFTNSRVHGHSVLVEDVQSSVRFQLTFDLI